jgi:hypothetical protein
LAYVRFIFHHIPWSTSGLKKEFLHLLMMPFGLCEIPISSYCVIFHDLPLGWRKYSEWSVNVDNARSYLTSYHQKFRFKTHCLCSMWTTLPPFHSKLIDSTAFAVTWLTCSIECEFSLWLWDHTYYKPLLLLPLCPNGMNRILPALSVWLCVLSRG